MSEEKDKILDLDDPSLKEAQQYDPEADYNAYVVVPELDDAGNVIEYQLRLELGENRFKEKRMYFKRDKNGDPFGILRVDMSIVQPGGQFDKSRLKAEYMNTIMRQRGKEKTSAIINLCRLLKSPMPKGLSLAEQGTYTEKLLAGAPILSGTVQWTAYCGNCEEDVKELTGERNWPEAEGGGHIAKAECPTCNTDLVPGVKVKRFTGE